MSEPRARTATNRIEDAELLRATRECVLTNGVRRTTLTDIARRAGVSRMTLYRRFPDVHSIVAALMTQEFAGMLGQVQAEEDPGTARQRLVASATRCVRLLQTDPLLRRVLDTDAEMVLPYLVERLGSFQLIAEGFLREYLFAGHEDGSVRRAEITAQTRALMLMMQSFVISSRPAATGTDLQALSVELSHLLDTALRPESSECT
jgi:AcrR family transcriptional regulator